MLLWLLLIIYAPVSEQSEWLTLLAPSSVFEGESMVLTCQTINKWKINTVVYYKDEKELFSYNTASDFYVHRTVLSNSGNYHCTAAIKKGLIKKRKTSGIVKLKVQELFPSPVLTVSPSQPIEGSLVTLTCQTQVSPQRPDVQLQFHFFKESRVLGSGWSSSADLQIPVMWSEDSGSYCCQAQAVTHGISKWSSQFQIHVQRVPVSNVTLQTQVPGGQVTEGGNLVLLCSVAEGTGNITFSWHRGAIGTIVGRKTQHSLSAELEIMTVKDHDAGEYYCRADNGYGSIGSNVLTISVKIPVSRPILTLRAPRAHTVVGDVVELHCVAQRGSLPILYQFYHDDVHLGSSLSPSGGGAFFNLSVTVEHSGNYSCEADNGLAAQGSEAVPLFISGYRKNSVTPRVLGWLFGVLGFLIVALLGYCKIHKMSGKRSATNACRDASSANPHESMYTNPFQDSKEPQPVYVNVGSVDTDVVYSQVWSINNPEGSVNIQRTSLKNQDFQVIYSDVKKAYRLEESE